MSNHVNEVGNVMAVESNRNRIQKTERIISIQPRVKYLSGEELIKYRHFDVPQPQSGLKRTKAEDSEEEASELKSIYEKLRDKLSMKRIDRQAKRTLGAWDEQESAVEVQRNNGKFEHFGYTRNGKLYLDYYEALFLLELGRLDLRYYEIPASIEQAYLLLLGEKQSNKYNKYFVYSSFMRAGYICRKHQPKPVVDFNLCNWTLLKCTINQQPVPTFIKDSPIFDKVQKNIDNIKNFIMGNDDHSEPPTKRPKDILELNPPEYTATSLIDCLSKTMPHQLPSHLFTRCNSIQLQPISMTLQKMNNVKPIEISFDLHLHNTGFKKSSPPVPVFYVVVLNAGAKFPNHDEITACIHQQINPMVPLLVVSVSESKQLQAFQYFIS